VESDAANAASSRWHRRCAGLAATGDCAISLERKHAMSKIRIKICKPMQILQCRRSKGPAPFSGAQHPAKIYETGANERASQVEFGGVDRALGCHDAPVYEEAFRAVGTGKVERDMRVEGPA